MEHVISMETSKGQDQSVLNETNQNQSIIANVENEQEISNERQEKNEQAADWESTAKTYLGTILDDDDQLIIKNEFPTFRCPKVPPRLRNSERSKDYFDPKIVSFGPYHHGKDELQAAEKIKTKVMRKFILERGKTIEDLYIKVRKLNGYAKGCYVDGSTDAYGDEEFALMMLQDGCFILLLIEFKIPPTGENIDNSVLQFFSTAECLKMIVDHLGIFEHRFLYRDMLLLENQIPFVVLKDLMSNIYNENEGLTMIKSYLYMMYWGKFQEQDTRDKDKEEPNHLLGLLKTLLSKPGDHHEKTKQENMVLDVTRYLQSSGSVSDLQAKGINLKPVKSMSLLSTLLMRKPKSICLRDVDFRSGFFTGELKLPPLLVGGFIQEYITNLIALEMSDYRNDSTVASYIDFINSLVDNPEDVKTLRSKRIILHAMNSDKEMFKLLKDLSSPDWIPNSSIYQGVREKIEMYNNNKINVVIKTWIADIRHEYFSHPWSAISFLAAVVMLILIILQTFFTIYPRKA